MAVSPIPSVKGTWNKINSPNINTKMVKIGSPDSAYYKSPFVLHSNNQKFKNASQAVTPLNGLKGSLVATST